MRLFYPFELKKTTNKCKIRLTILTFAKEADTMSFLGKNKDIDITGGPLLGSIIKYSIPLMIGSLIQVLFNAADLAVLGNMADKKSVAAVGTTGAIVGLLVQTFVGISTGSTIVLANLMGKKDYSGIRKAVDTSMIASFALGVVITFISIFLAGPMLELTKCPDSCFEGAKLYLIIYFAGIPAIMVYNFGAAILRTGGDSRTPLFFLIISGILNVILNIILCLVIREHKVAAVAIATLASQILGAVLVTVKLLRSSTIIRLNLKHPAWDIRMFWKILRYGIPCGFSSALYSISNLQIQSSLNAFGEDLIAGNSAAGNLETFVCAFTNSFALTSFTFVGQNIGAEKKERVNKTIKICLLTGASIGLVLGLGLFALGKPVLSIFIPGEEKAIEYGLVRMKFILSVYAIAACNQTLSNILQAYGKTMLTTILNIVTILVFRLIWMSFVYPLRETAERLYVCYTISWSLNLIALFTAFLIIYGKYKKGKAVKI